MIIKQKNIEKEFVKFREIDIKLEKNNIYLIDGENGTGKTTLMEALVFDTLDAEFESEELNNLYNSQRGRMFAYFSQNVVEYPGTVYDFLKKNQKELNKKDVENLLKSYRCDSIRINDQFMSLSGGERAKVALIAVLSKDTPYIFLDEPTNNLDTDSIDWFIDVVKNIKDKCIVLISHDKKVREIANKVINFKSDFIGNKTDNKKVEANYRKDDDSKKAVNYVYKSKYNVIYAVLLIMATIVLGNLVSVLEARIYTKEDLPPKNGILLYIMDQTYEELNQNYVKGRKLEVDDNNYEKVFPLIKIDELTKKDEVKEVYIRDDSVYDRYYGIGDEESENEKLIFSIPEVMQYNETFVNWMSVSEFTYLKEGRLPKDEAGEVVVSEKILVDLGIQKDDAIGSVIELEGVSYKIVGIGIEDIYLVSYKKDENRGIYCYDENTFETYYSDISDYYTKMLYPDYLYDGIFIETEEGYEKEVLKELICNYPATNYYSHDFAYVLKREFNKVFYITVAVVTGVWSLLYGVCLCSILGGHIKKNTNRVIDYVNYYIDTNIKNMYIRKYFKFILFNYLINIIVSLIIIRVKDMEIVTAFAVFGFVLLVQVPAIIVFMKSRKNLMERNINDC